MEKQRHPLDFKSHPSRPTVRNGSLRKSGRDGTNFTPTERRLRDKLMHQFCRNGRKGVELGSDTTAYGEGWERIFGGKK